MPELAEAETIARGLRDPLADRRIVRVEILHADLLSDSPDSFSRSLAGGRVKQVGRRGKNVILSVEAKDGTSLRLVVNLGMSGRLLFRQPEDPTPPPTHPGIRFHLEGGGALVYHDPRRFGRLRALDEPAFRTWSATLGPEPLGAVFTNAHLLDALSRSRSPIRSWLLDQKRVAGVGNIYANEALHRAGIHPATPASAVPDPAVPRLRRAIRRVLTDAIEAQGTTLRDYRTAQGWEGGYGRKLRVYGREGEGCPACRSRIERVVISNRSAFFCPACQPAPSRGS